MKSASFRGHQKVVELLLRARANPNLQDKVRTEQGSGTHAHLTVWKWWPKQGTISEKLSSYNYICICDGLLL